jgi:hypothetical protein
MSGTCDIRQRNEQSTKISSSSSSSSTTYIFHVSLSDLFRIRKNLELWILQTVVRTLWTGDEPCRIYI